MGFNMSWLFVDGIDEEALYTMLDLVATDVRPDPYDLGTSRVPLAGSRLKSGWSAVFAKYSLVMDAMFGTSPPRVAQPAVPVALPRLRRVGARDDLLCRLLAGWPPRLGSPVRRR
jgi:hypothetical protein